MGKGPGDRNLARRLPYFIHVGTRRAFTAGVTANPDSAWVAQQARNASMQMAEWGLPPKYLLIEKASATPAVPSSSHSV